MSLIETTDLFIFHYSVAETSKYCSSQHSFEIVRYALPSIDKGHAYYGGTYKYVM